MHAFLRSDNKGRSGKPSKITPPLPWNNRLVIPWDTSRELKKLRRQLQRKRLIKIELCVKLSLLRLFHVDHVVQNSLVRTLYRIAWYQASLVRMVFVERQRRKDLLLRAPVVDRASSMKISRRRLADYVKRLHQKACRTCSTIICLHSTNQIIDLWRCRWGCRCQILSSLLRVKGTNMATIVPRLPLWCFVRSSGPALCGPCIKMPTQYTQGDLSIAW